MPAPDLAALFAVEPAIEVPTAAFLASQAIPVFTSRSLAALPDRRIDFQLQLGNVTGHMHPMPGGTVYDRWNAHFVFRVVTPRSSRGIPDPFHDQMRSKLRLMLQYAGNAFTADNLPYHTILSLMEHGTDPNVDNEQDLDISEIRFASVIGIRDSAWPVCP